MFRLVRPCVAAVACALAFAVSAADAPSLDLLEIDVYGNSVLDEDTIYRTLEPYLGPGRSLDDVDRARDALEEAYRRNGYKTVAVTIPRQTARDGVVRLEVVESRVGHLNVVGSNWHSIDQIRSEAGSLAEGGVPDFDHVQDDIVALNRDADLRVTPALKPGAAPNTVDVDLAVDDTLPLHGSAELNNRRSANTAELRSLNALSFDNLFQRGHSLSLSWQVSPQQPKQANVIFGSYLARFARSPFSLMVNGIKSDSDIATVNDVTVLGRGQIIGARLFVSLPGTDELFPSFGIGADYKRFTSDLRVNGLLVQTPVEYVPFVAALNFSARDHEAVTQANFSVSFASPQIGSTTADLDNSRTYARGQLLTFKQSVSRLQPLPYRSQLLVRMASQLTDQPLISNEQFSAGGADSVRGYLESEALGDYGFSGALELRHAPLPDGYEFLDGFAPIDGLRTWAFVDGAVLRLRRATPGVPTRTSLLSSGLGLSVRTFERIELSLEWARPLLRGPISARGNDRLLFRLSTSY